MTKPSQIGTATLFFDLQANTASTANGTAALQLLPAGEFRARDGRPSECKAWVCTAATAGRVIDQVATAINSLVIDYEHQTINATNNGQPAPAAGFFKQMEWRDGAGVFATEVEWTAKAKAMIADGEYRYLSPVFTYNKNTGEVLQLLHAALTNTPALDGMTQVALRSFAAPPTNEESMNETLIKLLAVLGLAAATTEADAITAVTVLKTKADQVTAKDTEIAALKAVATQNPGTPDPAKFVPIEAVSAIQQQLAALSMQVQSASVRDVVTAALKEGRLLPAQEAWATALGTKDIASLNAYLASTSPIAALKGQQTGGQAPTGGNEQGLNADQLAVCKSMGISVEEFKKSLPA